jgi:hypothetical protein
LTELEGLQRRGKAITEGITPKRKEHNKRTKHVMINVKKEK